jgi:hypothetical protein
MPLDALPLELVEEQGRVAGPCSEGVGTRRSSHRGVDG